MAKKTYVWKDPGALTIAYVVVLAILVVGHLGSGALALVYGAASEAPSGDAPLNGLQFVTALFNMLLVFLFVACVLAIFWALRMSRNAHTFGRRMEHTPAAAVYWYIVPFASLIKPFGVMEELFSVSGEKRAPILRVWWTLFLVGNISGTLAFRIGLPALDGVSNLIQAASAGVFIAIALRLRTLQRVTEETSVFSDDAEGQPILTFA